MFPSVAHRIDRHHSILLCLSILLYSLYCGRIGETLGETGRNWEIVGESKTAPINRAGVQCHMNLPFSYHVDVPSSKGGA